jgi:hypothetical protein
LFEQASIAHLLGFGRPAQIGRQIVASSAVNMIALTHSVAEKVIRPNAVKGSADQIRDLVARPFVAEVLVPLRAQIDIDRLTLKSDGSVRVALKGTTWQRNDCHCRFAKIIKKYLTEYPHQIYGESK